MSEQRQPPAVEAYGGGGFRIEGVRYEGSVLILDDQVRPWPVASLAELTSEHFAAVFQTDPGAVELTILGLGPAMVPPPRVIKEAFQAARIGFDVMETTAACRLYNLLAADGRRVAAALIAL